MRIPAKRCRIVAILLLGGCSVAPEPPPEIVHSATLPEPAAAPPSRLPWPGVGDCRALAAALVAMSPAERARLDPATAPLGVTLRAADGAFSVADGLADPPLPADDGRRRCALLIEVQPGVRAAPRRILGHERVRSAYRTSAAGRPNPEYRRLQEQLRDLERADAPGVLATGDPGLDLIGLVAGSVLDGITAAVDQHQADALRRRLADTPARLDEVDWEPYSFEVTTLEAARAGGVRAFLVDRRTGDVFALEDSLRETRRFRVAQGRRARDRGLLEGGGDGLVDPADVAAWEQSGVRPGLISLLAALPSEPSASAVPPPELAAAAAGSGSVVAETGPDGVRRFRLRGAAAGPELSPDF